VTLGVLAETVELPRAGNRLPAARADQAHGVDRRVTTGNKNGRAQERTPPHAVQSVHQDFAPRGLLVEYPLDAALEILLRRRMLVGCGQPQEVDAVAGE
jgi:hypothetical protein